MAAMGDDEALFALHAPPDIGTPAAETTGDTPTARIASATELLQESARTCGLAPMLPLCSDAGMLEHRYRGDVSAAAPCARNYEHRHSSAGRAPAAHTIPNPKGSRPNAPSSPGLRRPSTSCPTRTAAPSGRG